MSWLKAFGQKIKTIFDDVAVVEKKVEPIVEAFLPQSTPLFDVFDVAVEIAKSVEGSFAAAGVQTNGPAKLAAALPGFSAALDAYTTAKFPGTNTILKDAAYIASKTILLNAVVAYLNALPDSAVGSTVSSAALIAAAATSAAVKAASSLKQPAAAPQPA